MKIEVAAGRLEALCNATRLRIYRTLVKAGDPRLPVGKLQGRLGVPPSNLSHHLKTLLTVGLITQERDATTFICRANYPGMRGLVGSCWMNAAPRRTAPRSGNRSTQPPKDLPRV